MSIFLRQKRWGSESIEMAFGDGMWLFVWELQGVLGRAKFVDVLGVQLGLCVATIGAQERASRVKRIVR